MLTKCRSLATGGSLVEQPRPRHNSDKRGHITRSSGPPGRNASARFELRAIVVTHNPGPDGRDLPALGAGRGFPQPKRPLT